MIKAKTASKNRNGATIEARVLSVEFVPQHFIEADDAPLDTGVGSTIVIPDAYIAHTEAGDVSISKKVYKRLQRQLSRT